MSVYVDGLFEWPAAGAQARRVGARNRHRWCHLMADTIQELHAFAIRIGMRLEWFQGDHYDLTPGRRAVAVRLGAIETTSRELVQIRKRLRAR